MKAEMDWVRIERVLEAPIERVWDMWTDPALFALWYGPNGMTIPVAEMDVVVGGRRKICMKMEMPDRTMTMWFTGEYKEVDRPYRLVYSESLCDEAGNIVPPQSMGMPEGHPSVTEVIVELSDVGGKTRMKMTHIGVPAESGGAGGWAQAIEKLAAMA
ncbi:SRPBCC family protein [Pacificispira sp.]|uniref:SRPBCC family protein n=1 Tax=Pacificispira sp. TaxID=2888761 RepID=UPI003B51A3EB